MSVEEIQKSLPEALMQKLSGYEWQEILVGHSSSRVFRLTSLNKAAVYLKIAAHNSFPPLRREKDLLDWVEKRLPVPRLLIFTSDEVQSYLLLSEIPGVDASHHAFKGKEREVIEQMTTGLRRIHGLTISDCPFDARLDYKIELAEKMMRAGLVDENEFDEIRQGKTAEELFCELVENRPASEDLVFTHGDFCLPNIILENGNLSGFVDWGGGGVADRYQDIALLARSITHNFGKEWTEFLFETLDLKPDSQKLYFYTLLDEFF